MSKNIAISDDVYRKLTREMGDRSFSDVIEEKLETGASSAMLREQAWSTKIQ